MENVQNVFRLNALRQTGVKSIQTLNKSQLGCTLLNDNIPFISKCIITALLISVTLTFTFRYEIFIMSSIAIKRLWMNEIRDLYVCDTHIACFEEHKTLRNFDNV